MFSVFRFQGSPWVKKTHLSLQVPEGFSQDIMLQVVAILYNYLNTPTHTGLVLRIGAGSKLVASNRADSSFCRVLTKKIWQFLPGRPCQGCIQERKVEEVEKVEAVVKPDFKLQCNSKNRLLKMDNGIENKQRMNRTEVNSFNQF